MAVMAKAKSKVKIVTFWIDSIRDFGVDGGVNRMRDSTGCLPTVLPVRHSTYGMFHHIPGIEQVHPLCPHHSHRHNTIVTHRLWLHRHRCCTPLLLLRTRKRMTMRRLLLLIVFLCCFCPSSL